MQYNNIILRIFIIVLILGITTAWATETTWRHSGFEVSGYDINFSQVYNITNLRVLNFGWNTSVPAVSAASKATMYYDDTAKQIKYSVNGGTYQQINDVSTAIGILPNASIPATAMNVSESRFVVGAFTRDVSLASGTQSITGIGFKPSYVQFYAAQPLTTVASWGFDNGVVANSVITAVPDGAGYFSHNDGSSIYGYYTVGNQYYGHISSMDSNGFTVTWTKAGTPTGTLNVKYTAYK